MDKQRTKSENAKKKEMNINPVCNDNIMHDLNKEETNNNNISDSSNSNIISAEVHIVTKPEYDEEDVKKNASKYVPVKYSYSGGFFDKNFTEIEVQMNLAEVKISLVKACKILKELNYTESRKKYCENDFPETAILESNLEDNSEELVLRSDLNENTLEKDL